MMETDLKVGNNFLELSKNNMIIDYDGYVVVINFSENLLSVDVMRKNPTVRDTFEFYRDSSSIALILLKLTDSVDTLSIFDHGPAGLIGQIDVEIICKAAILAGVKQVYLYGEIPHPTRETFVEMATGLDYLFCSVDDECIELLKSCVEMGKVNAEDLCQMQLHCYDIKKHENMAFLSSLVETKTVKIEIESEPGSINRFDGGQKKTC